MDETCKDMICWIYIFIYHTIEYLKPQYIRKVIKEFDNKLWHDDLQKKNSLILYREYKHVIHDEQD